MCCSCSPLSLSLTLALSRSVSTSVSCVAVAAVAPPLSLSLSLSLPACLVLQLQQLHPLSLPLPLSLFTSLSCVAVEAVASPLSHSPPLPLSLSLSLSLSLPACLVQQLILLSPPSPLSPPSLSINLSCVAVAAVAPPLSPSLYQPVLCCSCSSCSPCPSLFLPACLVLQLQQLHHEVSHKDELLKWVDREIADRDDNDKYDMKQSLLNLNEECQQLKDENSRLKNQVGYDPNSYIILSL